MLSKFQKGSKFQAGLLGKMKALPAKRLRYANVCGAVVDQQDLGRGNLESVADMGEERGVRLG